LGKQETNLQKKIKKQLLNEFGGWWVKTHGDPFQRRGLPDLHGTIGGYSIWIEVKVPGREKELTDLQAETLRQISEEGGGLAFMSTSPEHAKETVKNFLQRRRRKNAKKKNNKLDRAPDSLPE